MMLKFRKVYICDHCNAVALPAYRFCGVDIYKTKPEGWGVFAGMDFCPKCYSSIKAVFEVKVGAEDGK